MSAVAFSHECPIDHNHETAWWCDDSPTGTWKLVNVQRDVLALTQALQENTEAHLGDRLT